VAGSIFCHGHNPQSIKSGGAPEGNKNAVRNGLYSKYLSADEQEALALVGEAPRLDGEIEATRMAFAKLYAAKTALIAADMLNDQVVSWFEQRGLPLLRVLTDRGTEYCGLLEHHEYELYLAVQWST
jgi:hypothetical protein